MTAPLVAQNGWLIVASASGLTAFRAEDGTTVWSRDTGAQRLRATIEGDNLYVPLDDGRLLALDLRTGAERWKKHLAGARFSEVLAFSDFVYVGSTDKFFYCFDADDGAWEWHSRLGAVLRGRPVAEGAHIFVTSVDNTLRAYDRNSGKLLWYPSVPFRPAAPVVVGSAVIVPGNSPELLAFDAATGRFGGPDQARRSPGMPSAFGASGGHRRDGGVHGPASTAVEARAGGAAGRLRLSSSRIAAASRLDASRMRSWLGAEKKQAIQVPPPL